MATKARAEAVVATNPSIAPEHARDARARAWAFVFECFDRHEKEAVSGSGGGEDNASEESAHEERRRA